MTRLLKLIIAALAATSSCGAHAKWEASPVSVTVIARDSAGALMPFASVQVAWVAGAGEPEFLYASTGADGTFAFSIVPVSEVRMKFLGGYTCHARKAHILACASSTGHLQVCRTLNPKAARFITIYLASSPGGG